MGFHHKSLQYVLSLSIPIVFLVFLIAFTNSVEGVQSEYDVNAWSDDIQLTNDTGTYPWKQWLTPKELAYGRLNMLYANENSFTHRITFSMVEVDKLGNVNLEKYDIPPYPPYMVNGMHGAVAFRGIFYNYDEDEKSVNIVQVGGGNQFRLFKYNVDTEQLDNATFHISEALYGANWSETSFSGPVVGCLDDMGRMHIAMLTVKDYSDGTHQVRILYLMIKWAPIQVQPEIIWTSPRVPRFSHIDKIVLSEDGQPVIGHAMRKGDEFYRAISVKDISGNWSTHILYKEPNPVGGKLVPINGLMVDKDDLVHMVWVDLSIQSLRYINASLDGKQVSRPVNVTMLPVGFDIVYTGVDIEKTEDGDLLFAFNINPYTPIFHHIPGTAEIDLVVVPNADFSYQERTILPLVQIPSASDCVLLKDDNDNLFLFWFDSRTGSIQLYMKYLARPGISLEIDPDIWLMSRYIRPNETKVIPLNLRNVGTVELDAEVYVESNASLKWDLSLSHYRTHLEAFSSIPVNLTIYCPANALHGETIEVWVNATTLDQVYSSTLRLYVCVLWARELGVFCDKTYHLVDPGLTATYTLVLQNSGERTEDVVVKPRGVGPPDWTLELGEHNAHLEPGGTITVEVRVTAPEGAHSDDIYTTVLEFSWVDGTTAHAPLHLRTVVRPTFFVTMELNRTAATVDPGEVAPFNVTVGNVGNLPGKAYVEVTVLTEPGEWMVLLTAETVVLGAGATRSLELLLGAPADALGGDILVVRLRAYCPKPFSEVTADAFAEVRAVHALTWPTGPFSWEMAPMEEAGMMFLLANGGNLFETVDFRMDGVEAGWSWWFEEGDVEVDMVRLGPGEERELGFWFSVPADAGAGLHRMRLYVEAVDATLGHVDIEVRVRHVGELDLNVRPLRCIAYPGGNVEMAIEVRNLGNSPDVVYLSASGLLLDEVWFLLDGVNATSVWVPRGGSREVILWARISTEASVGEHWVDIVARSTKDSRASALENGTFEVVLPELRVVYVELTPGRPKPNDIVTVRVMLLNDGPLEIINVSVIMEGTEPELITSIAPDGEAVAVFSWVPEEPGKTVLRGTVSFGPGEHVEPWSHVVDVGGEAPTMRVWMPALFAMVALIVLSAILAIRLRRPTRA